ncbi:MAG: M20/M25/M40 family metallo-hydrolase [Syntrophomonadaceae bacterium]|nr:M20/M25/M40 family metallo-hydrolase [Syntrophomonadaceae bacterium]
MVNKERLIESFIHMVGIDSVSGKEGQFRDYLTAEFSARGYQVQEDEAGKVLGTESGNLLIKIPGMPDKPSLLFAAHMDTVEPGNNIEAIVKQGRIVSTGNTILGSDDKAAIAALLEAVDVLKANGEPHAPLELLFTVGEEQGLQGAKLFNYSRLSSSIAYVLDAGGPPGNIIVQSPCQNEIEYQVFGKAAHAGINPQDGINAIHIAAQALAAMPCGRIDEETTCNFGIIEGGTARNIVADSCRIKGEARSLQRVKLDALTDQLQSTFISEVEKHGAQAQVKVKFLYPEIQLNVQDKVVVLAVKAAQSIGLEPVLTGTGGGSDASIINGHGIACVNLGIGMSNVHTIDEYIEVDDLVKDVELILAIIREI